MACAVVQGEEFHLIITLVRTLNEETSHTEVALVSPALNKLLEAAIGKRGAELTAVLESAAQSIWRLAALGEELVPAPAYTPRAPSPDSPRDSDYDYYDISSE